MLFVNCLCRSFRSEEAMYRSAEQRYLALQGRVEGQQGDLLKLQARAACRMLAECATCVCVCLVMQEVHALSFAPFTPAHLLCRISCSRQRPSMRGGWPG